ncbi:hypothetical protein LX32DRAFT_297488 [Colletotrichum zoysiae]|uniref:Zn(2)-C6 fungal-type domain-containing protein n=1 Tax=Colletotrichum zoysiae TaxID=1216348 RepID=A0AAD9HNI0_9PEZI|nr:hypothetical protein LX32DRAFT_297488 [Colletotrichum zoysiae]
MGSRDSTLGKRSLVSITALLNTSFLRKRQLERLIISSSSKCPASVRMSLRKTSCLSCVASKRRCDRVLPACQRCSRLSLSCRYPYPPAATVDLPLVYEGSRQGLPLPSSLTLGQVDNGTVALDRTEYDGLSRNGEGSQDNHTLAPGSTDVDILSMDWLADLPDLSTLLHDPSFKRHSERHSAIPRFPPRHTRLQDTHQAVTRAMLSVTQGPMNLLSNSILGPWNRFDDVVTWRYCASEMLSYISLYATRGTSPIATITNQASTDLDPVLRRALGICAAHGTLTQTQKHVFDQLLDYELEQLAVLSQSAPVYDARWQRHRSETILRETTARLQALTMYQIILLYSDRVQDFQKAAAHEALFASWTRELQLQVHLLLQQRTQSAGNTTNVGFGFEGPDPKVMDAAHRAILIAYTVRAVHSILNYKRCAVWNDLLTITMPTSLSGPIILLYPEYVDAWERGTAPTLSEDNKRLSNLIVAACKGLDAVKIRTA